MMAIRAEDDTVPSEIYPCVVNTSFQRWITATRSFLRSVDSGSTVAGSRTAFSTSGLSDRVRPETACPVWWVYSALTQPSVRSRGAEPAVRFAGQQDAREIRRGEESIRGIRRADQGCWFLVCSSDLTQNSEFNSSPKR